MMKSILAKLLIAALTYLLLFVAYASSGPFLAPILSGIIPPIFLKFKHGCSNIYANLTVTENM
jgi:hypothetical protein